MTTLCPTQTPRGHTNEDDYRSGAWRVPSGVVEFVANITLTGSGHALAADGGGNIERPVGATRRLARPTTAGTFDSAAYDGSVWMGN
jgi:hypothetical protein